MSSTPVLVDVLRSLRGGGDTPYLDAFRAGGFNDPQVAKRLDQFESEATPCA